jgi:hypothetical protein
MTFVGEEAYQRPSTNFQHENFTMNESMTVEEPKNEHFSKSIPAGHAHVDIYFRASGGSSSLTDWGHVFIEVTRDNGERSNFDFWGDKPGNIGRSHPVDDLRREEHQSVSFYVSDSAAEKMIDKIDELNSHPSAYDIRHNSCVTNTTSILDAGGISQDDNQLPKSFWEDVQEYKDAHPYDLVIPPGPMTGVTSEGFGYRVGVDQAPNASIDPSLKDHNSGVSPASPEETLYTPSPDSSLYSPSPDTQFNVPASPEGVLYTPSPDSNVYTPSPDTQLNVPASPEGVLYTPSPDSSLYSPSPDTQFNVPASPEGVLYTPSPDSNLYTPSPESNFYTPAPEINTYTPPPDVPSYTPPPDVPSYTPPPDVPSYTPPPNF